MKYTPINKMVLVETGAIEEKLGNTGLIKAPGPQNKVKGIVRAISKDCETVKVGDHIYYGCHTNIQAVEDERNLWLVKETEIVAIIKE